MFMKQLCDAATAQFLGISWFALFWSVLQAYAMPQAVISVLELCNFTDSFSCSGTSEEAAAAYEMSQGEYRGFEIV